VRTLIVSDLHLGGPAGADVLRKTELSAPLLDAVRDADRVVLLGDLLELRDSAAGDALELARPFFEDLGRALSGAELVLIAGNHDHALVAPWLARKTLRQAAPLGVEQRVSIDSSPILRKLAQWVSPASLEVSYPGLWVRDDVYATHGHYLDCHMGITSGERLMIALSTHMPRLRPPRRRRPSSHQSGPHHPGSAPQPHLPGPARGGPHSVDEYEAAIGSLYARLDTHEALRRFAYSRVPARLGMLLAGLSHEQLPRAERAAMGEVAARLGLGNAYVVFGHTHRAGPLAGEDPSRWQGRDGARLINCGCWLEHALHSRGGAPSALCVMVEGNEPPVLVGIEVPLAAAPKG
jgi:predicted phosphodiesterase